MGDIQVLNDHLIKQMRISEADLKAVTKREQAELLRRNARYREGKPFPNLANKIVFLVDDGIATGATMKAALFAVKKMNPKKVICVAPVSPPECVEEIEKIADEVIVPLLPENFNAVGLWYDNFPQTDDSEVLELLKESKK